MNILVWQWGRRGAGPLVAHVMATALARLPGTTVRRSFSTTAELLTLPHPPANDLPMRTYQGLASFAGRGLAAPVLVHRLARQIRALRIDVALCAMPAPLDFVMAAALRRAGVPYAVVVHDAQLHPGDAFPLQIPLQRALVRGAALLVTLSTHVADQLRARGLRPGQPMVQATLPPLVFGTDIPPVRHHGGPVRLLSFGRLLPYKGLDLLADAMERLPNPGAFALRVVGLGPESEVLDRLRALPFATVENRWVPEAEIDALLGWSDALVLTHREASQSGVAAAALGARRWVVSTRVGGLAEQLADSDMALLCATDPDSIATAIASLPDRAPPPTSDPTDSDPTGWNTSAALVLQGLGGIAG